MREISAEHEQDEADTRVYEQLRDQFIRSLKGEQCCVDYVSRVRGDIRQQDSWWVLRDLLIDSDALLFLFSALMRKPEADSFVRGAAELYALHNYQAVSQRLKVEEEQL